MGATILQNHTATYISMGDSFMTEQIFVNSIGGILPNVIVVKWIIKAMKYAFAKNFIPRG